MSKVTPVYKVIPVYGTTFVIMERIFKVTSCLEPGAAPGVLNGGGGGGGTMWLFFWGGAVIGGILRNELMSKQMFVFGLGAIGGQKQHFFFFFFFLGGGGDKCSPPQHSQLNTLLKHNCWVPEHEVAEVPMSSYEEVLEWRKKILKQSSNFLDSHYIAIS